jgi:hypothetical protein
MDYYVYCDACISGACGVHLGLDSDLPETVYLLPFPPDIQELFRQKNHEIRSGDGSHTASPTHTGESSRPVPQDGSNMELQQPYSGMGQDTGIKSI